MRLSKDNSGITLVELIISMAIAAIVLSMVAIMISTAAKSFRHTNENVDLQMEAQITMNQLSTYIMEAYSITEITDPAHVTGDDAEFQLSYGSEAAPTYNVLYFISAEKKLYLITDCSMDDINQGYVLGGEDEFLMAEHVTDIIIDNSNTKIAEVEITFGLGNQTYIANKNIKLRNAK